MIIFAQKKVMTLIEMLSSVEDHRSVHGLRHKLSDILLMCIMAMMSGYSGYREIGRFLKRNEKEFRRSFGAYHGVPCYVTIREVLQSIDFDKFSDAFNEWAMQYVPVCKGEGKAIDGKAIGSTTTHKHDSYQNFVSLISLFSSQRGIVLACKKIENKKEGEIPKVQELIKALDINGEIFTLDALHCQKKLQT
jgi:hypothetical protein